MFQFGYPQIKIKKYYLINVLELPDIFIIKQMNI